MLSVADDPDKDVTELASTRPVVFPSSEFRAVENSEVSEMVNALPSNPAMVPA